jgi:hypothetical protein
MRKGSIGCEIEMSEIHHTTAEEAESHFESLLSKIDNEVVKSQLKTLWSYTGPGVVTPGAKEFMRAVLQGLAYQLG